MKFSRRKFLASTAAAAAVVAVPPAIAAADSKLNVLFIGVDDLNCSLGCYGQPVQTPNLDALAARGVRFASAYCQYPLCGPSRNSLLTGLAPDTTHILNNHVKFRQALPEVMALPELFRKNGYYSARVGKIFHASNPIDEGRDGDDDPKSWDYKFDNAGVDRTEQLKELVEFSKVKTSLGAGCAAYESPSPDRQITDSIGADEVIRLLKQNKDKPFFIAYGLYRPHVPWIVPKTYFEKYPLDSVHAEPFNPAEMKQAPRPAYNSMIPNLGMDEEHCKLSKQAYYSSITFIDTQIGRVLGALKTLGLQEKTLVVFWSDHGWQLGQHGLWEKQTLFEWATHVPFMMAGPGIKSGGVVKHTTEHLDMYPTVAEICGLRDIPKLHGKSMIGLLKEPDSVAWDKPAVTQVRRHGTNQHPTDGYSIRTGRYRYTMWNGSEGGEELYDYQDDPREVHNRAADPAIVSIKQELKAHLLAIRQSRTT